MPDSAAPSTPHAVEDVWTVTGDPRGEVAGAGATIKLICINLIPILPAAAMLLECACGDRLHRNPRPGSPIVPDHQRRGGGARRATRSTWRWSSTWSGRKRTSSGLDGLLLGVEDVDAVDVERNIGCARLGRAIHAARWPALLRLSRP